MYHEYMNCLKVETECLIFSTNMKAYRSFIEETIYLHKNFQMLLFQQNQIFKIVSMMGVDIF